MWIVDIRLFANLKGLGVILNDSSNQNGSTLKAKQSHQRNQVLGTNSNFLIPKSQPHVLCKSLIY